MIMRFLTGLPAWAWKVIGGAAVVLALIVAFNLWLSAHDEALINEHERALQEAIAAAAAAADESAAGVVAETRTETEKSNADARNAANGSDDPLRSALDSLRD